MDCMAPRAVFVGHHAPLPDMATLVVLCRIIVTKMDTSKVVQAEVITKEHHVAPAAQAIKCSVCNSEPTSPSSVLLLAIGDGQSMLQVLYWTLPSTYHAGCRPGGRHVPHGAACCRS